MHDRTTPPAMTIPETVALAQKLHGEGYFEQAEMLFRAAVDAGGGYDSINGLGMTLNDLERHREALKTFDDAYTVLRSNMAALLANRAKALAAIGQTKEALAIYDQLLKENISVPYLRFARSLVYLQTNRYDECVSECDAVLALEPDNDVAKFTRGFAHLARGDYAQGFRDYEARKKEDIDEPDAPEWTGEQDLTGKTILIHADMGYGDNIMFSRYLYPLVKRAANVIVALPESQKCLVPPGAIWCNGDKATWPQVDYWTRFMSLGFCFRTTQQTIPPPMLLEIDLAKNKKWTDVFALTCPSGKKKIGLCWSGGRESRYDNWRSVPLEKLEPIFKAFPDAIFYSFQLDLRGADKKAFRASPLIDITGNIKDFDDTAHALAHLDLFITCDTAIAHMAGTVGVPTLVMLTAYKTYWLWINELKTSPWYPSVKVFRQQTEGDWTDVIEAITEEIRNHA